MTLQDFRDRISAFLKGKDSPGESYQVNRWLQKLEDESLIASDTNQFRDSHDRMLSGIRNAIQNQSRLHTSRATWIYAAASVVILVIAGYVFRSEIHNTIDPINVITYSALPGQQRWVILPDSTEVWLNAASTLQTPDEFRGDTRNIQLKGEAFFKVHHDVSKPFYVHSGKTFTRVLGTSFNVKAYSEQEPVDVTVLTGKVAVGYTDSLDQQHEITRLTPGRHVRLAAITYKATEDSVEAEQETAWIKQQLIFHQATLEEMVLTLERWYSVDIQIDQASAQSLCTFNADYLPGTALEEILKALELTDKISYKHDQKTIIIYPKNSCLK